MSDEEKEKNAEAEELEVQEQVPDWSHWGEVM